MESCAENAVAHEKSKNLKKMKSRKKRSRISCISSFFHDEKSKNLKKMKSQKKRQLVSGYGGPGGVTLFRKNRSLVVMGGLGGLPRFLR